MAVSVCRDDIEKGGKRLLISIIGGIVITYFTCPGCRISFYRYTLVSLLCSLCWIVMWLGNSFLGHYLDKKLPWTESPVKRLLVGMITSTLYPALVIILLMESFQYFLHFDIGEGYNYSIYLAIGLTILISLFLHGRGFLMSWKDAANHAERLEKESAVAKYESLKNQVNPHFLFNSLNALTNLVYEDQDKAVKFIKQLSEVYRYVLDTRDQEVVSLQEELEFLKSYLFLQSIRFGNNLKTIIDISSKGKIAPLALQMLIENAIKHNIVSSEDPLSITVSEEGDFLVVENNLQKKKNVLAEPSSGIGLVNICKRYEFLSDKKVEILKSDNTFKVKLPIIR